LQSVVTEVRRFRAEQGLRPGQRVPAVLVVDDGVAAVIGGYAEHVGTLTRLDPLDVGDAVPAGWPAVEVGGVRVALDLSNAIDVGAERARLTKDLAAAERERDAASVKLSNPDFTGKAPDNVVAKIRDRLAAAEADIARIARQLDALPTA
jgi:valyl-tRNA synthetase